MKNVFALSYRNALFLGCGLLFATSCTQKGNPDDPNASGKIIIKGSNTIGEELAPRLIAAFNKDHPKISVELESRGTDSGMDALMAGQCDIAAASRVVTTGELDRARSNHVELQMHSIGSYAIAVVVSAKNSVTNLSRDEVKGIFTGSIQNWKVVGGPDAPIHLYVRDKISGTYLGFRELAMDNQEYATPAKAFTNYTQIVEATAADPAGIGYASLDLVKNAGVKGIPIRGTAPDTLAVEEGRYPFARLLRLYTNKAKESAATMSFIGFVQSDAGQQILKEAGFIPRP
jgi:phosphate transport system substrate-binding protein